MPPSDSTPDPTFTALTEIKVTLERMAGDIRATRDEVGRLTRDQSDHESRLRDMERAANSTIDFAGRLGKLEEHATHMPPERLGKLEEQVTALARWKWSIPSFQVVLSVAALVVAVYAAWHGAHAH